ncbi:MAG: acyl-CoA thioesterase [Chloroflexota bacterium]|nr:acyl-CoA thioesterase [Chloroflexota bacterium]
MTDAPYRHHTSVEVRFRDLDALRHVNNAVYLTYFEHARLRYLRDVIGIASIKHLAMVLASITCDYLSPVHMGEELEIATRVDWIGRTSLGMSHVARAVRDDREVARADSVLVSYDYRANRPQPVSAAWRASFTEFEGRSLDRERAVAPA